MRIITVTGQATTMLESDEATVIFQAYARGHSRDEVTERVMNALQPLIDASDEAERFLQPMHTEEEEPPDTGKILHHEKTGYYASKALEVRGDLNLITQLITQAQGLNDISASQVEYGLSPRQRVTATEGLEVAAVEDAMRRAERMAVVTGASVGSLVRLDGRQSPVPHSAQPTDAVTHHGRVVTSPTEITVTVEARFELV